MANFARNDFSTICSQSALFSESVSFMPPWMYDMYISSLSERDSADEKRFIMMNGELIRQIPLIKIAMREADKGIGSDLFLIDSDILMMRGGRRGPRGGSRNTGTRSILGHTYAHGEGCFESGSVRIGEETGFLGLGGIRCQSRLWFDVGREKYRRLFPRELGQVFNSDVYPLHPELEIPRILRHPGQASMVSNQVCPYHPSIIAVFHIPRFQIY